jgi:ATP-dependent DNA ligase
MSALGQKQTLGRAGGMSALPPKADIDSNPAARASIFAPMVLLRERTRPGLGIIEPCLPSPAKAPPSGPGWLHEIKHDGFRILARRDGAGVRIIPWR